MKFLSILCSVFLISMSTSRGIQAQEVEGKVINSWFQAGLGLGFVEDIDESVSGLIGFQVQNDKHLFSMRMNVTGSIIGKTHSDIGVLYGQVFTPLDSKFFGSTSLGVGITSTSQTSFNLFGGRSSGSTSSSLGFGVPVQASAQYRPFKFLGIGLTGTGFFSKKQSYSGLMFSIHVGDFRD